MMMQFKITESRTKEVVFENVFLSHDSATLEQLKELSSKRKVIEKSTPIAEAIAREIAGGLTSPCQQDLHKLEQYLPLLENLVHCINKVGSNHKMAQWISELKIRWSSGLSSPSLLHLIGPKFFQFDSIRFELGMTLFLYAVKLRDRAVEVMSTDLVQSATLHREAAGVFHHLAHDVLPPLQPSLPAEKPPEVAPSVCSAISLLCLAEGQAVTARRAEEKGTSAALLTKLHFGVSQLVGEASLALHSGTEQYKEIASRFLEYISSLAALHELRSQRYLAEHLKSEDKLGVAIGVLHKALSGARKKTPGEESWKSIFKKETKDVCDLLKKFEHENDFIWREKIPPPEELPLPQGSKIVNIVLYRPERWERQLSFKT